MRESKTTRSPFPKPPPATTRDPLNLAIATEYVSLALPARDFPDAVHNLSALLATHPGVGDLGQLQRDLGARHASGPVEFFPGIVLAHARSGGVKSFVLAVGRLESPIPFPGGGTPIRLLFVLGSPLRQPAAHLRLLAALARQLAQPAVRERLLAAAVPDEIATLLAGSS
jgi:fructose PTS system EIIA component